VYNDIIVNGLPIIVSGHTVEIYDYLDDVSNEEAMIVVSYLYEEGFLSGNYADYKIIRGDS